MNSEKHINPGDMIRALGHMFTVGKVLYQDYNGDREQAGGGDCWGYDVEFLDTSGGYHHWKQNQDHGEVIRGRRDV